MRSLSSSIARTLDHPAHPEEDGCDHGHRDGDADQLEGEEDELHQDPQDEDADDDRDGEGGEGFHAPTSRDPTSTVTPAKAGVPLGNVVGRRSGIPAFAGMTEWIIPAPPLPRSAP